MAVSGHGSEGHAGSQGEDDSPRRLLSLWFGRGRVVWLWGPGPSSPPDAGRSCPAGCRTPSWVKVQPQGAPLGSWAREPLRTSEPPTPRPGRQHLLSWLCRRERGGWREKGEITEGWREGSGCPQEGRLQKSEMQFGSPRAAGPSDEGLGEAGGGPWTHASSVRAEREGGQGSWGRGAGVRAGHGLRPPAAPKLGVSRGAGTRGRRPRFAALARPRPSLYRCEAFKDTSAPAQRGCVCVSVSACV